jgi:glycogen debranching enzyme
MTEQTSEVRMLPITENQRVDLHTLEEKEQPTAPPQITLKCGDAFVVADARGDFLASRHEMGLYWQGTRFLRTCNLFLDGHPLVTLSHHVANMGNECQIDATNEPFIVEQNNVVEQGYIHVERRLELGYEQLVQVITVTSFWAAPIPVTLSLKLGADFCDLFEVRGLKRETRGQLMPPKLSADAITLGYCGLDNVLRETHVSFSRPSEHVYSDKVHWRMLLTRGQPVEIRVAIGLSSSSKKCSEEGLEEHASAQIPHTAWRTLAQPSVRTDDHLFNRLLTRGAQDLMMLSTMTPHGHYPYAGIPWFACPFGRDGLITCLEFLPWFPEVVRGTLGFLAAYQGMKIDPFTDEEPGKMLHEMRTGEMANRREIPYIPYYGSVDVTPLFLITLEGYIRWTNDLTFLTQIWPNIEAAVRWMQEYGDSDGDGFLEYQRATETGLANQGWKDSWDAISHADSRLASGSIALCEVQGYAYAAYRAASYLAERLGKAEAAIRWDLAARTLQENFLRRFWWEEEQVFHLALDGAKEPCDVVSSNSGQCLWSGIVPEEKAHQVVARLMREDMYSGWGIRTLSSGAARYNPMSYHNGSVWPHDNAMMGAGFAHYGRKTEAGLLLRSLYQASLYFDGARLPELYCGFSQRSGYGPTRYPVACSPQAWAAGSPFLLVNALLGLQPDAEQERLALRQPTLPDWLHTMEIQGLQLGERRVHLHVTRSGERTEVRAGEDNEVEVQIHA